MIRDDYADAGVPMLPVVEGEERTRRAILLYVLLLDALTLLLFLSSGSLGWLYLGGALLLGGLFTYYAVQLLLGKSRAGPLRLYKYSLLYLALLFGMIMLDSAL
jgi:protoheme IX farnesyltransferase